MAIWKADDYLILKMASPVAELWRLKNVHFIWNGVLSMNIEIIKAAQKAATAWKGTDTYGQAASIIQMLIDELEKQAEENVSLKAKSYDLTKD